MVTQEDIAKNLNITRTTVARALRGQSVSEKTRVRVVKEAKRLGYVKNTVATSLVLKRERTIYAFVVATVDEEYGRQMCEGIQQISTIWSGYHFTIKTIFTDITKKSDQCKSQLDAFYNIMETEQIDGIIFSALSKENMNKVSFECMERKIPLMTLDMIYTNPTLCHVGPDYYKLGTYSAAFIANLMMRQGNILTLSYDEGYEIGLRRMEGFSEKLKEYSNIVCKPVVLKEMTYESYCSAIKEHLESFRPIAIYAPYHVDFIGTYLKKIGMDQKIILISNGVNSKVEDFLEDGTIRGIVSARPRFLGSAVAYNFFKYFYRTEEMHSGVIDVLCDIYIKENYRRFDELF